MLAPLIVDARTRPPPEYGNLTLLDRIDQGYVHWGFLVGAVSLGSAISALLSWAIGLLLEHWRHGWSSEFGRAALGYGFLIFAANCIVALIGCAITGVFR